MRWPLAALAAAVPLIGLPGCASRPAGCPPGAPLAISPACPNPLFVSIRDPQCVWETVTDVVDDYFRIQSEEPARLIGSTITEGRLETFPEPGATLLEPWRGDSVGGYERLESTLQTIRRRVAARVTPAEGGYWIDVAVFKELENMARPEQSTAGAAIFRYDTSLTRVIDPVGEQEVNRGWIPYGRDDLLEQRILQHVQSRFAGEGSPVLLGPNRPY